MLELVGSHRETTMGRLLPILVSPNEQDGVEDVTGSMVLGSRDRMVVSLEDLELIYNNEYQKRINEDGETEWFWQATPDGPIVSRAKRKGKTQASVIWMREDD